MSSMKKIRPTKTKLSFAALLLAACAAQAEFKDGNRMLSQISGDNIDQMNVLGYITGVTDTVAGVLICAPSTVTAGQVKDVVRKHLEANPGTRHMSGDWLTIKALSLVWPCEKKGKSL